jgi:hypothetical protein
MIKKHRRTEPLPASTIKLNPNRQAPSNRAQKGSHHMKKISFSPIKGAFLIILLIPWLLLAAPALSKPPAEKAYDHYEGHFGAKNVKPPYIGEIRAAYYDGAAGRPADRGPRNDRAGR